jgi:hypothetical protein
VAQEQLILVGYGITDLYCSSVKSVFACVGVTLCYGCVTFVMV